MTESHTSKKEKTFSLAEIAALTKCKLVGDPQYIIRGVADLESAQSYELSFLSNLRYQQVMKTTQAGVIIVDAAIPLENGRNYLIAQNPSEAFQIVIEAFYSAHSEITGFHDIHPTAVIHPTAKLGKNVSVGPYAVIDKDASVGEGTTIGAGCYVGLGVTIGTGSFLYPHAVIRERCLIGNGVILQPGVVIGSCGFGYLPDKQGRHIKLKQIGSVRLDDAVEVGANTTIDRARFQVTHVKTGTKIDNLVQIAHGVILGEHNIIVAQTGIAGSTETGHHVIMGGQVAVDGHLKIENGVRLAARSGVSKSLPTGTYSGAPTMPVHQYNRMSVLLRHIEDYVKQIKDLTQRLEALEKKSQGS